MTTDKSQEHNTGSNSDEVPAVFATIHHKSDHRPDGYTEDEIANMNRMANGKGKQQGKSKKTLLIASGTILATLIVAGSVWAMKTNAENKARAAREALILTSPPPTTPEPQTNSLESMEAYFTPPDTTVRGLFIGQDRESTRIAAEERGMIVYKLSANSDSFYSYSPRCVEEIETARQQNRSPFSACQKAGEALYENGTIKRFELTPAAFGIERISLHEFVQAITDNFQVSDFRLEVGRKLVEGTRVGQFVWGPCEAYVGSLASGTKVEVSACGFGGLSAKFEASPTENAQFN